jgi:penicillin-binding protein 2
MRMTIRDEDDDDRRRFTRRALIAGSAQAAAFAAIAARVYYLQVVEGRRLATLANDNRMSERPILPKRGRILDRNGRVLAANIERFRVWVCPGDAARIRPALEGIAQLLKLSEAEIDAIVAKAKVPARKRPVLVRTGVDFDAIAAIGLNAPELSGIEVDAVFDRTYAHGTATGHVVGHTGSVEQFALDDTTLFRVPGARIGKTGIELGLDRDLRGQTGSTRVEVDARGDIVRVLGESDPVSGQDVTLTIDAPLQQRVLDLISGSERAAAVVINVENGEVVAMASAPAYDPNLLTVNFDQPAFARLEADPHKPLINRAAAGLYPPGSTFKMVTALAALEAGVISTSERVSCRGAFHFAGETFRCWNRGGHGAVDLAEAIRKSCDVYFYDLAERLGVDRIAAMAKVLGLGQTYACGLGGQKDGLIPTTGWKRAVKGKGWLRGETILAGIGQGYVLATPLQLAVMTARLATGRVVVPTLVKVGRERMPPGPIFPPLQINPDGLDAVRRAMIGVVHAPDGTGGNAALDAGEVLIAGKTGTSQVWASGREAAPKEERYELRDHALFVSFFPATAPRYAVSLVVEHGGSGGQTAAPLVRDLARLIIQEPSLAANGIAEVIR